MAESTESALARGTQADLEELRSSQFSIISLTLALLSCAAWVQSLPGAGFRGDRFLIFLTLFSVGAAAYSLRARCPWLARLILLFGPTLTFTLALRAFEDPLVPCFAVLIVIANASIEPHWGFAAALLNSVPLCVLRPVGGTLFVALALLWLTAALEWLSSRGLYTALQWAWNSQQRASQLLEQLRDRQGKLNQTLAALTEATRRLHRTGHELAVARRRAEEARQMKEQFAANISHELRTPLNLILGFSEMMYLTPDVYGDMRWPTTLRRDVRQIYQSSRQLLDLINDVLDLARIDAAQMPVQREQCDLAAIIDEAVGTTRDLLRGRDLELRTILPDALPTRFVDRTRIRQVLLNLLNNAARFTERGTITVSVQVNDREVVTSVADTGPGIPPEEIDRVFGEFHQVDMSLRRRREGAGLGLAISKRFVELHGGRIWVESQLGRGSTFHFSLPKTGQAATGHLLPERAPEPGANPDQPTVVVVDQDPAVGTVLGRYLRKFQVLQAADVAQATATVAERHPRALIVNAPPGAQVWPELQQAMRALPPKVPVLLCSLPSQSWLALEANARGCLAKPLTREELLGALQQIRSAQDVLVVDDDRGFVQLVVRILEASGAGYRVRWAYEGAEALSAMRERRPDVVLLDLIMPGTDGFQVLQALDADEELRSIAVLIVTATSYGQDALARHGSVIALGRAKAFGASEVISHLQALLDGLEPEYPADSLSEPPATGPG